MNFSCQESQYDICLQEYENEGSVKLGYMSSFVYRNDPKRLAFILARYKFVAKMFSGFKNVLEIGCGDAFGSPLVAKESTRLVCSDFDRVFIGQAKILHKNIEFIELDFTKNSCRQNFNGIFSLDVLEHIPKDLEDKFMKNLLLSINNQNGVAIIGMPSLESQIYASKESKEGHINCKNGNELKSFLGRYFENVFLFSMNDEIVHTGFYPMAHYLLALCVIPKKEYL